MSYRVGQVLFVVLNKKMQLHPLMVVEEITKRTFSGEETSYVVQGGPEQKTKFLLSQVDGEIFESPDEAKHILISRASQQVERLVDGAVHKANLWYKKESDPEPEEKDSQLSSWYNKSKPTEEIPPQENPVMSLPTGENDTETQPVRVQLPDGTIANLKNFNLAG